jgi:rare lipoprotein A
MRLPVETIARALALILVPALAGCGSPEGLASAPPAAVAVNGPAADYPVVIGEPYRVGSVLYTPADTMNYDEVGYAAADSGEGVSGSHHTLPLPSYVEVTSLTTGHTILVRLERRGPMSGDAVVALSPAAFVQLGASAGEPVRVRRVNPPEEERAALRAGRTAPSRMDTPASLVAVLKRKLSDAATVPLTPRAAAAPKALTQAEVPASSATRAPAAPVATPALTPSSSGKPSAAPALPPLKAKAAAPVVVAKTPAPKAPAAKGAYIVQAATMSTRERAEKVVAAIGGSISSAGRYFRVRTGPFATRAQAEASLAKVRSAGYSDARIFPNG